MTTVVGDAAVLDEPHEFEVEIDEPEHRSYERSPVDLMRLAVAVGTLALAVLLAVALKDTMSGFETDVRGYWDQLPDWATRFLYVLLAMLALIYPLALLITLAVLRRWRAILVLLVAGSVAGMAARGLNLWLDLAPTVADQDPVQFGAVKIQLVLEGATVASAAATATVLGAYVGRRWGRVAWGVVAAYCLFRIIGGNEPPLDLFVTLAAGWVVGIASLLAAGTPDLRPDGRAVVDAMARAGLPLRSLKRAGVDARGSTPWFATTAEGDQLFVKTLGRDERSADLMFRVIRYLRLKNVGDERPFSSLRRAVEHEAFISLKARDGGVRTPRLTSIAAVEPDAMLLAFEAIGGSSLDGQPDETLTDEVLDRIWAEVAAAGMPSSIAVPGVLAFRLATFWIPILPGWLSFNYLNARHRI
jgi:glycosyltransferase 2 family protein